MKEELLAISIIIALTSIISICYFSYNLGAKNRSTHTIEDSVFDINGELIWHGINQPDYIRNDFIREYKNLLK